VQLPQPKVQSLTGEGGKLRTTAKLLRGKDFELIPERLWKTLQQWYGGSLPLPRQVPISLTSIHVRILDNIF
jgi:ubiquitin carboxyl-terminal hydrolase 6/32